jgi:rhamnulose-1-phosphate aldolase
VKNLLAKYPGAAPAAAALSEIAAHLWQKGWAERNAGNLSVDVTEAIPRSKAAKGGPAIPLAAAYPALAGRYFLTTGTGRRFRDVPGDPSGNVCLLRLSDDGASYRIVWGGADDARFRPTSEFPAHLRVHEFLRETAAPERVVLHTHPTELIALTHLTEYRGEAKLNRALFAIHPEVRVCVARGVGYVPYVLPGSEALAQATVAALRRGHGVALWEMHGCVAVGVTAAEAFDAIDTLNKGAQIILLCRAAGREPHGLTQKQLRELERAFNLPDCS